MTRKEYERYKRSVADFFEHEGIDILATGLTHCPDCEVRFECNACPECGKDAIEFPNEPYVSSHPCDCCGDPFQGMREDATGVVLGDGNNALLRYVVCEDCVYYNEYGRLGDTTMAQIEEDGRGPA
jgi:hypothetical protein